MSRNLFGEILNVINLEVFNFDVLDNFLVKRIEVVRDCYQVRSSDIRNSRVSYILISLDMYMCLTENKNESSELEKSKIDNYFLISCF